MAQNKLKGVHFPGSDYGEDAYTEVVGGWGQTILLHSMGKHIASIGYDDDGERVAQVYDMDSPDYMIHLYEFLNQNGFRAETMEQIQNDYFVEV